MTRTLRIGGRAGPGADRREHRGTQVFTPTLDLQARRHQRTYDELNDVVHKKKVSAVTLPTLKFQQDKS
jgi:hypothetical protein